MESNTLCPSSSDLWVTGSVPNSKDSGKSTKLEYAVGEASGDIFYAPLTFDGFNVTDQAFRASIIPSYFAS